jgi:hypothetical protein
MHLERQAAGREPNTVYQRDTQFGLFTAQPLLNWQFRTLY